MKKRTLVITLNDGQQITQDLHNFIHAMQTDATVPMQDRLPLNPSALHDAFKILCFSAFMEKSMETLVENTNVGSKDYRMFVVENPIKSIEVIFHTT